MRIKDESLLRPCTPEEREMETVRNGGTHFERMLVLPARHHSVLKCIAELSFSARTKGSSSRVDFARNFSGGSLSILLLSQQR